MRVNEHDLNSLRGIIRRLQEENASLKKLLDENNIIYSSSEVLDATDVLEEYDEDQGARIISLNPDIEMAKEFYSYFWGRTDVYARRGKTGGYFPRCLARWNNPDCPKNVDAKRSCDEDCPYKSWEELTPKTILCHMKGYKEDCSDVIGV